MPTLDELKNIFSSAYDDFAEAIQGLTTVRKKRDALVNQAVEAVKQEKINQIKSKIKDL